MKVEFVIGYGSLAQTIHQAEMSAAPHKGELVVINDMYYTVEVVKHFFTATGRGGNYDYSVTLQLQAY